MICSLNEIEALARKAARGGGMSWGLAEETGKAVRWLSDNGFPGPRLLADLLRLNDGKPYGDIAPRQENGTWSARGGLLCPVIAGVLICDRADELSSGEMFRMDGVAVPLLMAPFAAEASRSSGVIVALEWQALSLILNGSTSKVVGDKADLIAPRAETVSLRQTVENDLRSNRTDRGRHVTPECLEVLESFARRTYAPATEASRAGAGAGKDPD